LATASFVRWQTKSYRIIPDAIVNLIQIRDIARVSLLSLIQFAIRTPTCDVKFLLSSPDQFNI
jgi:hypothetical protein